MNTKDMSIDDVINAMRDTQRRLLRDDELPLDGSLYKTNQYLTTLSNNKTKRDFYRRYLLQLKYFISLHQLEGVGYDISERFISQLIEFGSVAAVKINDKLIPLAISHIKYDIYGEVETITGQPVQIGYGYVESNRTYTFKGSECVIVKSNYRALPFMFFWKNVIENEITLLDISLTGATTSIKKYIRRIYNNDSELSRIENESMLDPSSPTINVVAEPLSYKGIEEQRRTGSVNGVGAMQGNMVDVATGATASPLELFEVLNQYMEFEYFQLGRRVNTNKKNERNISAEVDTEVVNFEVLDNPMEIRLDEFAKQVNEKLGYKITYKSIMRKIAEENADSSLNNKPENEVKIKKGTKKLWNK